MNERELDAAYTLLARTLSDLGEAQTALVLARLAVLALARATDAASAERLVRDAAAGLGPDHADGASGGGGTDAPPTAPGAR